MPKLAKVRRKILEGIIHHNEWGERWGSNPRPSGPQPDALPTELRSPQGGGILIFLLRKRKRKCKVNSSLTLNAMQKSRAILKALLGLNIVAMPVVAELLWLHYKPSDSSFCNFNEQFNCDVVNQSIYSEFLGVPVAIWGLLVYGFLLVFSAVALKRDLSRYYGWVTLLSWIALGFALYLTGVEMFILKTFCIFCLSQQIIILMEAALWLRLYSKSKSS